MFHETTNDTSNVSIQGHKLRPRCLDDFFARGRSPCWCHTPTLDRRRMLHDLFGGALFGHRSSTLLGGCHFLSWVFWIMTTTNSFFFLLSWILDLLSFMWPKKLLTTFLWFEHFNFDYKVVDHFFGGLSTLTLLTLTIFFCGCAAAKNAQVDFFRCFFGSCGT
jgi:hypothetical protein